MQERWDHENEKSELEKQLRELNKEDYLDLNTGGLPKYYEKKNQLLTDIKSVNDALEKDKETNGTLSALKKQSEEQSAIYEFKRIIDRWNIT